EVSVVIGDGIQTSLLELRFDLIRVPPIDAESEVGDLRHSRRPLTATAAAPSAAAAGVGLLCRSRRGRRRLVAIDEHRIADGVADLHHAPLTVVVAHLPAHDRGIEGNRLLVVDALVGEVIEPGGLPARRLERRRRARGIGRRAITAATATPGAVATGAST